MEGVEDLTVNKNGNLYFLSASWTTAVGGLTSYGNMLNELEAIFG